MKIIDFLKKIFFRQNVEKIEAAQDIKEENSDKKDEFLNSIKVKIQGKIKKKRVKTMVCDGDGLGISNKMDY